jgi:hypothetical protein
MDAHLSITNVLQQKIKQSTITNAFMFKQIDIQQYAPICDSILFHSKCHGPSIKYVHTMKMNLVKIATNVGLHKLVLTSSASVFR